MLKYYINDYVGKKYGHLKVIGKSENSTIPNAFLFLCDCGKKVTLAPDLVLKGRQKSCGKCKYANISPQRINPKDFIGSKNNLLTVTGVIKSEKGKSVLICSCDCGKTTTLLPYQFKSGKIKSCGCLLRKSPNFKDGRSKNELYGIWYNMIGRCENPNHVKYYRYGKRGISVCGEWHNFWNFVKWSDSVGGKPKGFTLDRIDNDGNYCPENCRWASSKEQSLNKSTNRIITYNGSSKALHEWDILLNISDQSLANRLDRGWSLDKALTLKKQTK